MLTLENNKKRDMNKRGLDRPTNIEDKGFLEEKTENRRVSTGGGEAKRAGGDEKSSSIESPDVGEEFEHSEMSGFLKKRARDE